MGLLVTSGCSSITTQLCNDAALYFLSICLFFFQYVFHCVLSSSSQGVTVSLNTTSGIVTSFELSDNTNDQSGEQESEYEQGEDELAYHKPEEQELYTQEYPEEGQYEGHDPELSEDQIEYGDEPEEEQLYNDEVLDIEINEPLDEFTVSLFSFEWPKITWLPPHRFLD